MEGFEWDDTKRVHNISKHGLDFVDAVQVFLDPNRIERTDSRFDYKELRFQTIGQLREVTIVVLVVWTQRGTKKRIISARVAHSKERNIYEKQN